MPVPSTSGPAISRRLHKDAVFDHLVAAILDGSLQPGERVRDVDCEGWLRVSRTPIRVALAKLEHVQLLESRGPRATSVVVPRRDTAFDLVSTGCALLTAALGALTDPDDEHRRLAIIARSAELVDVCRAPASRPAAELVDAVMDAWAIVWSSLADHPSSGLVLRHAHRLTLPLRHHLRALSARDLVLLAEFVAGACTEGEIGAPRGGGPSPVGSLPVDPLPVDPLPVGRLPVGPPPPGVVSSDPVSPRHRPRGLGLRRRLSDDVHDLVLAAVLDGTLAPGERLVDDELIDWLGVSRTPIRQAIERLDSTGLVELAPNRYTRVADPQPSDVVEARELYASLVAWAGGHLAPADDPDDPDDPSSSLTRLGPIVERAEGRPLTLATAACLVRGLRGAVPIGSSRSLSRELDLLEPRLAHGVVSCGFGLPEGSWRSVSSALAGPTRGPGRGPAAAGAMLLRSLAPQAG